MKKHLITTILNVLLLLLVAQETQALGLYQISRLGEEISKQRNEIKLYEEFINAVPFNSNYRTCGSRLLARLHKPIELLALYYRFSSRKDDVFLVNMLAVIYVESRFEKTAHSEQGAHGLMQLTRVAVTEATMRCDLRPVLNMDMLTDSALNIRYGSCYLSEMLDDVDQDLDSALILYNGGIKQLTKYNRGERITNETANYVLQINKIKKEMCRDDK